MSKANAKTNKHKLKTESIKTYPAHTWRLRCTGNTTSRNTHGTKEETQETKKAAYNVHVSLTESIYQSIDMFSRSKEAKEIFGETFVELFCSIKDLEVNAYNKIITAWEREYLLLNV